MTLEWLCQGREQPSCRETSGPAGPSAHSASHFLLLETLLPLLHHVGPLLTVFSPFLGFFSEADHPVKSSRSQDLVLFSLDILSLGDSHPDNFPLPSLYWWIPHLNTPPLFLDLIKSCESFEPLNAEISLVRNILWPPKPAGSPPACLWAYTVLPHCCSYLHSVIPACDPWCIFCWTLSSSSIVLSAVPDTASTQIHVC